MKQTKNLGGVKMKVNFYYINTLSGEQGKEEAELIANLDSMEATGKELSSKIKWEDKYIFSNLSDAKICILTEEIYRQYAVKYKDEYGDLMWCIKTIY